MATETIAGPLGEVRAASTAGGGTALTSTAARIFLPPGTKQLELIPRNMAGATVVQWLPCPWLTVLKTTDLFATTLTDYSFPAQDNDTAAAGVDLSGLDTLANLDALYVGCNVPFSGVAVDVDSTNSNASVLTVTYWNGTTWTDTSATDGTTTGGATFGQDGNVTWTVPTAWTSVKLKDAVTTAKKFQGVLSEELFWTRWVVSAALDASTTADSMVAIPRSTVYSEIPAGMMFTEAVTVGPTKEGISAIQAKTDAGTANLIVNCAARGRFYA